MEDTFSTVALVVAALLVSLPIVLPYWGAFQTARRQDLTARKNAEGAHKRAIEALAHHKEEG